MASPPSSGRVVHPGSGSRLLTVAHTGPARRPPRTEPTARPGDTPERSDTVGTPSGLKPARLRLPVVSRDVPNTVRDALADVPIAGKTALEAGAGVGNGTAGLLSAGADRVVAVTNERDHAETVHDRCPEAAVLQADLTASPLAADTAEVLLAHGLFNVLPVETAAAVARELTRVAAPGAWLVVDDYAPHPPDSRIRQLFAVENALSAVADTRPAYVFHPAAALRRLFGGHGWDHERTTTLLDPVPWSDDHVQAHLAAARRTAAELPDEIAEPLVTRAERLAEPGADETGRMYSLALRYEG